MDDAMTAIAAFPTIVGSYWRLRNGDDAGAGPRPISRTPRTTSISCPAPSRRPNGRVRSRPISTRSAITASTPRRSRRASSCPPDPMSISAITGAVGALKGPLARRRTRAGARHGVRDRHAGARGARHPRQAGSRRASDGIRPSRLPRPRSARRRPGRGRRALLCERRRSVALRSGPAASKRRRCACFASASPTAGSIPTSSSTRRCCCTASGLPSELFTPTFAVGRVARLVGALSRAASRRPTDPAAVGATSARPAFTTNARSRLPTLSSKFRRQGAERRALSLGRVRLQPDVSVWL